MLKEKNHSQKKIRSSQIPMMLLPIQGKAVIPMILPSIHAESWIYWTHWLAGCLPSPPNIPNGRWNYFCSFCHPQPLHLPWTAALFKNPLRDVAMSNDDVNSIKPLLQQQSCDRVRRKSSSTLEGGHRNGLFLNTAVLMFSTHIWFFTGHRIKGNIRGSSHMCKWSRWAKSKSHTLHTCHF